MPPKSKLHKSTGKLKSLPTPTQNENNAEPQLSPEATQQFELELCWCIQQLQTALKSGKLNHKQVQDHTKALNTLMSNSAPLVKKRQVMRLSFGDYRAKMAVEDKKLNTLNTKIKISQASPSTKSVFLKRSPFLASNNGFRFNFADSGENIAEDMSNVSIENRAESSRDADNTKDFHYKPSDNSFRFNFEIAE